MPSRLRSLDDPSCRLFALGLAFFPFSVSSAMKLNSLIRVELPLTQPLRALAYDAGVDIDVSIFH